MVWEYRSAGHRMFYKPPGFEKTWSVWSAERAEYILGFRTMTVEKTTSPDAERAVQGPREALGHQQKTQARIRP
jgi:hypothetical protein